MATSTGRLTSSILPFGPLAQEIYSGHDREREKRKKKIAPMGAESAYFRGRARARWEEPFVSLQIEFHCLPVGCSGG